MMTKSSGAPASDEASPRSLRAGQENTGRTFGSPQAIDPARTWMLPKPMQREAVLLLMEMGFSRLEAGHRAGLSVDALRQLELSPPAPFRVGSKHVEEGEEA